LNYPNISGFIAGEPSFVSKLFFQGIVNNRMMRCQNHNSLKINLSLNFTPIDYIETFYNRSRKPASTQEKKRACTQTRHA